MKTLIQNYTFNAAAQTVTFTDYTSILPERILQITNVTDGIVIYQFNQSTKIGTVSGNVLTLVFDTTAMSNGDKLQIFYDDGEIGANLDEQLNQEDLLYAINEAMQRLSRLASAMGIAADLRVTLLGGTTAVTGTLTGVTTVATVTTVTGVTTVSTVTNLAQIGAQPAAQAIPSLQNQIAVLNNISNLAVT